MDCIFIPLWMPGIISGIIDIIFLWLSYNYWGKAVDSDKFLICAIVSILMCAITCSLMYHYLPCIMFIE